MALSVDIEKNIGSFRLKSSFEAENETLAILGASGCGKSMTLKCIAGVETPDRGRIVLDGAVLFDSEKRINLHARRRKTGYLFQDYALFPNMTVERNIACGIPKDEDKAAIVKEKISAFYLNGLETLYPSQLSGGQQQRVALARMLASMPRILMMDEPFSALDSFLRWQLEQEIYKVQENYNGTILFVSHNRDEVYRLCDRVVIMEDGRTQETLDKKALFTGPKTLSAVMLSGCKNISDARKTGNHELFAQDWNIELKCSTAVPDSLRYVGVQAHALELSVSPGGANAIKCSVVRAVEDMFSIIVVARVESSEAEGSRAYLRCELSKAAWTSLGDPRTIYIRIPEDKLLMMQS